jgi:prevent-host-death family protein
MKIWQFQQAKAKLTQLINGAKLEPQIISRHGVNEMMVLDIKKYQELVSKNENIMSFFRSSPLCRFEIDLHLHSDKVGMREIDL